MKASSQQNDIYEAFKLTRSNLFVNACPGSGKTTTICGITNLIPKGKRVFVTSFSNRIVNELKERIPNHLHVSTIHSMAFGILRKNMIINAKLSEFKNFIYAKKLLKGKKKNYHHLIGDIIGLMKLNTIDVGSTQLIYDIASKYGYHLGEKEIQDVQKVYRFIGSIDYSKKEEFFDFNDMLYLAFKHISKSQFPKYDIIILDEAQDINRLQVHLILRLLKDNGRIISVGDEKQAIFGFQGGDIDNYKYLKEIKGGTDFPLSVSYRCPKSHVKYAKKYFDNIEAYEGNDEGVLRNGTLDEARGGDFVICRNNYPLFVAFIHFLRKRKKSYIVGNDLQKSLLNLLNKAKHEKDFEKIIENKRKQLIDKGIDMPESHPSYKDLTEKIEILKLLIKEFYSIEVVKEEMENIFKNDKNAIQLMTIHKSKGLESDRVFWLNQDLLFGKNVKTDLDIYSEKCVGFVASTRSKRELIFCNIKV